MALRRASVVMSRSSLAWALGTLTVLLSAHATSAQDVAGVTYSAARCDSILAAGTVDSAKLTARLLLAIGRDDHLPAPYPALILQEVATRLDMPRPLRVPVFSGAPVLQTLRVVTDDSAALRHPVIDGAYVFTLRRNATVARPAVTRPSRVPGLDSAVLAAIVGAGTVRGFAAFKDDVVADSVEVQLRLTSSGDRRGLGMDLFAAMFPRIAVTDAVVQAMPPPEFPPEERKAALEGDVWLEVVVDVDGGADFATVEVLRAPTIGFARSALELLSRIRWTPARVQGCAVPQQVLLPIRFRLP